MTKGIRDVETAGRRPPGNFHNQITFLLSLLQDTGDDIISLLSRSFIQAHSLLQLTAYDYIQGLVWVVVVLSQ